MSTTLENPRPLHLRQPRLPVPLMQGVIDRRLLVNFRCDPDTVARLLPEPFRPQLVGGFAIAGICLLRLGELRPALLPKRIGLTSENAAHRIAVEWNEAGVAHAGVFIPRRDTNSRLNRLAGGRLFPGVHHAATFRTWETGNRFKLELRADDGQTFVRVLARITDALPAASIFPTLDAAAEFFRQGAVGWSARVTPGEFDGLELNCASWHMEPLAVERVESSFFDDPTRFPRGTAVLDSALLMRGVPHTWQSRGRMNCSNDRRL